MKQALEQADPVLLEPIMLVTLSVPEDTVGDVIGDLNSRRGRPQGMEPIGAMTEIKAEVPMAEMLSYAPDLRSITGGQGDYTIEFLRYEEVPGHLAQKVVEQAGDDARAHACRAASPPAPRPASSRDEHPNDRHLPARRRLRRLRAAPAARRAAEVFSPPGAAGRVRAVRPRAAHEGWMRERDDQAVSAAAAAHAPGAVGASSSGCGRWAPGRRGRRPDRAEVAGGEVAPATTPRAERRLARGSPCRGSAQAALAGLGWRRARRQGGLRLQEPAAADPAAPSEPPAARRGSLQRQRVPPPDGRR